MARKPTTEYKPFTAILNPVEAEELTERIRNLGFTFGNRAGSGDFMRMIMLIPDDVLAPYIEEYKRGKKLKIEHKHVTKFNELPYEKQREILALLDSEK